ncbi:hypothetical protein LMG24076_02732 [Trinickia soli]|nr:hypothetical protein LMG24076_02732 [Trinickia soli]
MIVRQRNVAAGPPPAVGHGAARTDYRRQKYAVCSSQFGR